MRSIYLDYNATTPLAPRVQEGMLPYLADRFADPTGAHAPGRAQAEAIEDARTRVAWAIGAAPDEIVFTSGATESCNLALRGVLEPELRAGRRPHVVVTAVDHAAVQGPARFLASCGADLSVAPCDSRGVVDPEEFARLLRPDTRLACVVHANDEVGAIQPVAPIANSCRARGVPVHIDAAQTLGKVPLDVAALGADLISLSAHKAYGPKGVGALWIRRGVGVEPALYGAGQERGMRSGMPNLAGQVGFGFAAALAAESVFASAERMTRLRDRLEARLVEGARGALVLGPATGPERLANTLCVALQGVDADSLLNAAPEIVATPCAGSGGPDGEAALSSTLRALGVLPERGRGAIRLSVGWYTEADEVDSAADALIEAWRQLR